MAVAGETLRPTVPPRAENTVGPGETRASHGVFPPPIGYVASLILKVMQPNADIKKRYCKYAMM